VQNELLTLSENPWIWLHMYYQRDAASQNLSGNGTWYLNEQYTELSTMFIRSHALRLPCMVSHEKHGVWTQGGHKWWTTPVKCFYDLRHVNNAAVLCKFTCSLVEWTQLYIQADGGHFEQLL
jgi:hypothetical protein